MITEPVSIDLQTKKQIKTSLGGVDLGSPQARKAMVFSLWDGLCAMAMYALVETYSVAAALSLDTPSIVIAMLGSLPLFLGSIGQLIMPAILDPKKGRKHYILRGVFIQTIFISACALSGFLDPPWSGIAFISAIAGYGISGSMTNGLWTLWIRDLVPSEIRGRHFAWRNRIFAVAHMTWQISAGLLARSYTTENAPWALYAIIFASASLMRGISCFMLSRQWEPTPVIERTSIFDFKISRQFLIYSLAIGLLQGTTAMAGPFFNVWFLRDLKFNFFQLSISGISIFIGITLFIPVWGKLADKVGNFQVMHLAALMLCFIPLPFLIFDKPVAIYFLNFYSGVCWGGFNLGNFNYLMESSGKEKPDRYISVAIATSGILVFIFGMTGGFLANHLPELFGWKLRSLFLLSSLLRLTVVAGLFRFIAPSKRIEGINPLDLFAEIPGYRAGLGIMRTTFRTFRKI